MKHFIALYLFFAICGNSFSQQGEATYFMRVNLGISFGPKSKLSQQEQDKIMEAAMKRNQKEFTLVFNTKESIYKQNAQLSTPAKSSGFPGSNNVGDVLYKNMKTQTYRNKVDLMGKIF